MSNIYDIVTLKFRPSSTQAVSGDYFSTLDIRIAIGRSLRADDDRADAPPVAVISHSAWRTFFNGNANAIGQSLKLQGLTVTVVGVASPDFSGVVQRRPHPDGSVDSDCRAPQHRQPRHGRGLRSRQSNSAAGSGSPAPVPDGRWTTRGPRLRVSARESTPHIRRVTISDRDGVNPIDRQRRGRQRRSRAFPNHSAPAAPSAR